ncbi:MAG: amidohydrolase family protein [Bacteroidales bacterium]|nr:amidohydrolase family protein [Bacteroidales bacterium]
MINRREFIKKAGMGAATIPLMGLARCGTANKEQNNRIVGGRVIDSHIHLTPGKVKKVLQIMDDNSIRYAVIIASIMGTDFGDKAFYEIMDAIKPYKNRLGLHYTFDWKLAETDPEFFNKAPDMLERAVKAGAIGLKNLKQLGLVARDIEGKLIAIDDPRLFPIWERAEKLGIPVAFHTGDPVAFFEPWDPKNERWEELKLHPEWSFSDHSKYPPLKILFEQANNLYKKFTKVQFVSVHVAGYSENLKEVSKWMDEIPNLSIDTAARIGELGKHPAKEGNDFFNKYQDRIMFGTDMAYWENCDVQGAGPCKDFTNEETRNFYNVHWRYFQTSDIQFDHPTPIQGNWKIDGIGLKEQALKKIYWDNAYRFYKLDRFGVA